MCYALVAQAVKRSSSQAAMALLNQASPYTYMYVFDDTVMYSSREQHRAHVMLLLRRSNAQ
jgi:hypothetical protein